MNTIAKIIQIEKVRYSRKGTLNILVAILLLFTIVGSATCLIRQVWPSKIEHPIFFVSAWSFVIHIGAQLLYFLLYAPGYFGWSAFYDSYRINKKSAKPWERPNWPQMKGRTIRNLIMNQLLVYPLMVLISAKVGFRFRFDDFPSVWEVMLQLYLIYLIQDFFFYWGHRCFHEVPALYRLHKTHHQYDSLYNLITQYFHPLDFVIANLLPSAMGFLFLGDRAHCFMFFFWQLWKLGISHEGHSGYEFPWSPSRVLPCVAGASYHDHHHSHNTGNYAGSCYLWDVILGTNNPYMEEFLIQKSD